MSFGAAHYRAGPRAHGAMFHHFHAPGHRGGQGSIDAATFNACVDFLGIDRLLSPEEWMWKARRGLLRDEDLCITFDDGLACQYKFALPVLERRGLRAFWFVCSAPLCGEPALIEVYRQFRSEYFNTIDDFYRAFYAAIPSSLPGRDVHPALAGFDPRPILEAHPYYTEDDVRFRFVRDEALSQDEYHQIMAGMMAGRNVDATSLAAGLWMGRAQIAKLAGAGHEIGLHSHSHSTILAQLDQPAQRREYERNFDVLRETTGRASVSVAHPCNSYGRETLEILRELGIEAGFCANMRPEGASRLEIPREDHANLLREMRQP
jgi:peptidoglycan/xylan/chitin deacetylase (PgdA/CDA1 family)